MAKSGVSNSHTMEAVGSNPTPLKVLNLILHGSRRSEPTYISLVSHEGRLKRLLHGTTERWFSFYG